ncbi:MBL fold metallo-hydrolase [Aurantiacibacter sp. D1-12]|uniref:MBL fold metallo-hydrolase n=1 Tax=Aurantiacibacter sp. D1-12 TaxID=2993658 RepID=UPI00237CFDC5|nr:MBL fold metallo-hydrolase [Aurantiacibacter sp. D1-12]MDE1466753.1 MBL fold metallo-hydrolase [Aurantiacibacter sp. D1-12]
MKLIVLGCGTSTGVPRIGNDWGLCDPNNPKNRRTRVSIIVESNAGSRLLVDTSPDLRQQLLSNNIDKVDAVFWTHDHADHCHGIDDLRPLRFGRTSGIPGFASEATVKRLKPRFSYVFTGEHGYPNIVELNTLGNLRMFAGFGVETLEMPHGPITTTAYRFDTDEKSIGYATDFSQVTDKMVSFFKDVDVLVTDCLRREPHPTHANLDMALKLAKRSKARKAVLSHLDKSMDYATLSAEVPTNVLVGYDGMQLVA